MLMTTSASRNENTDLLNKETLSDADYRAGQIALAEILGAPGPREFMLTTTHFDLATAMQQALKDEREGISVGLIMHKGRIERMAGEIEVDLSVPNETPSSIEAAFRRDDQVMTEAVEAMDAIESRKGTPVELAQQASRIEKGLSLASAAKPDDQELSQLRDFTRAISLIPAVLDERDAGMSKEERRAAASSFIFDMRQQRCDVEGENIKAPLMSHEVAQSLAKADKEIPLLEARAATGRRADSLRIYQELLGQEVDPLSGRALKLRLNMLHENLVQDPERRNQMFRVQAEAEVAATRENFLLDKRLKVMRTKVEVDQEEVGDASLSRDLVKLVRKSSDVLDQPGEDGLSRDHRVRMKSALMVSSKQYGKLSRQQLGEISDILMTKAAFHSPEMRLDMRAVQALTPEADEPERKSLRKDMQRA